MPMQYVWCFVGWMGISWSVQTWLLYLFFPFVLRIVNSWFICYFDYFVCCNGLAYWFKIVI